MSWQILETGEKSAQENMDLDSTLLAKLNGEKTPLLHLYEWKKEALTFGHFIEPGEYLSKEGIFLHGLDLAKRPTGGGIVFHNCDLAFSVLVPADHPSFSHNPLENYRFINEKVLKAITRFLGRPAHLSESTFIDETHPSFCMATPTKYDVMMGRRKVGGSAQRKTRFGYLHQGSIFIGLLPEKYLADILKDESVLEAMKRHSFPLLTGEWSKADLFDARKQLRRHLIDVFKE